jgi:2-amino-4-hydroxy-6-hydroxymethyldihydropteridine diphosphokinase
VDFRVAPGEVCAYVSVGSNIRPEANILEALKLLHAQVSQLTASAFYLSEPKGGGMQPKFINGVFGIATAREAVGLKYDVLRQIEARLGRQRGSDKSAPREIDLDLILYGDHIIRTPELTVPDPDIYRFGYIAVPLLELAPDLVLPDRNVTVSDLESAKTREGLVLQKELTSLLKRWLKS